MQPFTTTVRKSDHIENSALKTDGVNATEVRLYNHNATASGTVLVLYSPVK
jgi:hypothetical protein